MKGQGRQSRTQTMKRSTEDGSKEMNSLWARAKWAAGSCGSFRLTREKLEATAASFPREHGS